MKAPGIPVLEMATFAWTVNDYRQPLVTGTIEHINSARARLTRDKVKKLKKRRRGLGGFAETRKRLSVACGKSGVARLPTARVRRLAQIAERKATARAKAGRRRKRRLR